MEQIRAAYEKCKDLTLLLIDIESELITLELKQLEVREKLKEALEEAETLEKEANKENLQ